MSRLKNVRKRRGFSQAELAKTSGVSPATVNLIENGKRKPHPSTMRKLAAALGVEVEEIVKEESRVQVRVSGEDQNGRYREKILDFSGRRVDHYEERDLLVELYECPSGYRVFVENDRKGERELHPFEPDNTMGEMEYSVYSAEEIAEKWPEFGATVGVIPIQYLD